MKVQEEVRHGRGRVRLFQAVGAGTALYRNAYTGRRQRPLKRMTVPPWRSIAMRAQEGDVVV